MDTSRPPINVVTPPVDVDSEESWIRRKWPELAFFTGLTGMSMLVGFGATIAASKKSDPEYFDKGLTPEHKPAVAAEAQQAARVAQMHESGASLALRALRRATIYSVGGVSLLCFTVWKLSGAGTFQEFREKMGGVLPSVPRNQPPTSRTEFENLSDLFQYVIDEDKRAKKASQVASETESSGRS